MKKHRKSIFLSLSIFVILTVLLGHASLTYAQDNQGWTNPVNLSLSGIASNPFIVVDAENMIHAIWVDQIDGYKYTQSVDGITWSRPKRVSYPFDKEGAAPVMIPDASGSIQIFWIAKNKALYYAKATPLNLSNPAQWQSATVRIAPDVANYDVVLDSQGVLHLAYIHNVSSDTMPAGVYYRQALGIGGTSPDIKLYESEYFRSATGSDSSVRVAVSNVASEQNVYVVWDSRLEKRVYMAVSNDGGVNWNQEQQMKGVEDTGGTETPFNINVAATNDKVLMMWQVGEPGNAKCAIFSQWSENNGTSWGDVISVLGGRGDCPVSTKFISQNEDYFVAMMTGQVEPTLIAWNGEQWSNPQNQVRLPVLSNPLTLDSILLGCRFNLVNQNRLYVVGCDQGNSGDVWFLSRPLDPVSKWFTFSETWDDSVMVDAQSPQRVSSLVSASDEEGIIHLVWAQSTQAEDGGQKETIEYARWDGKEWTRSEPVISNLGSMPTNLSFTHDTKGRLLLSWMDGSTGELSFSWANAARASLASEWEKPVILPSPSSLIDSSDIVVDETGRIVVVYAISLNEERGVYAVQSTDSGLSWTEPVRVFDAVLARWEKVGSPKIALSDDGVLHVIFNRNPVRDGQPTGLYYSRSLDGGMIWNDPLVISEGEIQWSDIACLENQQVQVFWQEYDGLVYANLSQVSSDSGESWNKQLSMTGVNDEYTPVTLAADRTGNLHFIQILKDRNATTINQENLILQDWTWNGTDWEFVSSSNFVLKGKGSKYSLAANITPAGFLSVSLAVEYTDATNTIQSEVVAFKRFLDDTFSPENETVVGLLPTPVLPSENVGVVDIQSTPTVDLSDLSPNRFTSSSILRNLVGILLIGVGVLVTVFLTVRVRDKTGKK